MRIDRRGFFGLVGAVALLRARLGRAASGARAPAIHTATRNGPFGAIGPRRKRLPERGPFKPYPDAARLALPAPRAEPARALADVVRAYAPTPGFTTQPLSLEQLGRLLFFANGVTGRSGRTLLRAAPSAGALYAGEVYAVVERVQGLEPGVYYYDVADHELARLRGGASRQAVADALEAPAAVDAAGAVLVLTNVFRRYTVRYRNRGYRYALIDSGHIGENLRLSARSAGLGETAPLRFRDDALAALLGVDGREEAVCAVHAVGVAREGAPGAVAIRRLAEKQSEEPAVLAGPGPITRRYHEATKLVASDAPPSLAPPFEAPAPAASSLELPRRRGPGTSVEAAIRQRRSAPGFASGSVGLAELAFVLEAAAGHAALERAPGVDVYVVPHRVEGLEPGLYRYAPAAHRLEVLHTRDLRVPLTRACAGQRMAGSSAAALLMAARFDPSAPALGTRRYRDQLLESGAIGQRIYLAAEAQGLAARNLAAFLDDDLNALVGLDAARAGVLHVTVFGNGA